MHLLLAVLDDDDPGPCLLLHGLNNLASLSNYSGNQISGNHHLVHVSRRLSSLAGGLDGFVGDNFLYESLGKDDRCRSPSESATPAVSPQTSV